MTFQPQIEAGFILFLAAGRGPFYAPIQDGTLLVKLSAETKNSDSVVYNPILTRKNFVLSFDFQFEEISTR